MATEIEYNICDADAWAGSTVVNVGDRRLTTAGNLIDCTVAGTTDVTEPVFTTIDEIVVDGTASWRYRAFQDFASWPELTAAVGVTISDQLVTDDENWSVFIWRDHRGAYSHGFGTSPLTFAESCDATHRVILQPAVGESWQEGILLRSANKVKYNPDYGVAISIDWNVHGVFFSTNADYCEVYNLQFKTVDGNAFGIQSNHANTIIQGNLLHQSANSNATRQLITVQNGKAYNNIGISEQTATGGTMFGVNFDSNFANNLAVYLGTPPSGQSGFNITHPSVRMMNNISIGNDSDFTGSITALPENDGNISSDGTASIVFTGQTGTITNATNLVNDFSRIELLDCQPPVNSPAFALSAGETDFTRTPTTTIFGNARTIGQNNFRGPIASSAINMIYYPDNFDIATTTWVDTDSTTGTFTANATLSPDGIDLADELNDQDVAGVYGRRETVTIVDDNEQYMADAFVKAGTSSDVTVRLQLSGGSAVDNIVSYDLATQTVSDTSGGSETNIIAYPDDWFRIIVTTNNNGSGNTSARLEINAACSSLFDFASTGSSYWWGASISQTDGAFPPQRYKVAPGINLCQSPYDLANAPWATINTGTRTANSGVAPDGQTTAALIDDTSAVADYRVRINTTLPDDSLRYVFSLFVKAGTSDKINLELKISGGTEVRSIAAYDLATGTVNGTFGITDTFITAYPNGWYLCSVSVNNNGTGNTAANYGINIASDGPFDIASVGDGLAWGGYLEQTDGHPKYFPGQAPLLKTADVQFLASGIDTSNASVYVLPAVPMGEEKTLLSLVSRGTDTTISSVTVGSGAAPATFVNGTTGALSTAEHWVIDSSALLTSETVTVTYALSTARLGWSSYQYLSDQLLPFENVELVGGAALSNTIDVLESGGVAGSSTWTNIEVATLTGLDEDFQEVIEGTTYQVGGHRNFVGPIADHPFDAAFTGTVSNVVYAFSSIARPGVLVADSFYGEAITFPVWDEVDGTTAYSSADKALIFTPSIAGSFEDCAYIRTDLVIGQEYTAIVDLENDAASLVLDFRIGLIRGSGNIDAIPSAERVVAGTRGTVSLTFIATDETAWFNTVLRGTATGGDTFTIHSFVIQSPAPELVIIENVDLDIVSGEAIAAGEVATLDLTANLVLDIITGTAEASGELVTLDIQQNLVIDIISGFAEASGEIIGISTSDVIDLAIVPGTAIAAGEIITLDLIDNVALDVVAGEAIAAGETITADVSGNFDLDVIAGLAIAAGEVIALATTANIFLTVVDGESIAAGEVITLDISGLVDLDIIPGEAIAAGEVALLDVTAAIDLDIVPGEALAAGETLSLEITADIDLTIVPGEAEAAGETVSLDLSDVISLDIVRGEAVAAGEIVTLDVTANQVLQIVAGEAIAQGEVITALFSGNIVLEIVAGEAIAQGVSILLTTTESQIPPTDIGTLYRVRYALTLYDKG